MNNYDFDLGSSIIDNQFDQIEGLSWYPWVGHNYMNSERRVLIVAESHYVIGDSADIEKLKAQFLDDKLATRKIVAECPICKTWQNNMFDNLHRCLLGISNLSGLNTNKLWSNLAFYNFIQKPVDYSGKEFEKERPQMDDFYNGWKVFVEVVKILKPTECIFIGVTASDYFNQYMDKHNIKHSKVEYYNLGNKNYGRIHSLSIDEFEIPILSIKHTSKYFSWEKWYDFLMINAPALIRHLGKLSVESIYAFDGKIRHRLLNALKQEDFHYYYVVGEREYEFDEDDILPWLKIWVTLGRLRDDGQLECVTIGCYDKILVVQTGIRKNPKFNLFDTINNSWWTTYKQKNFDLSDCSEEDIMEWINNNKVF